MIVNCFSACVVLALKWLVMKRYNNLPVVAYSESTLEPYSGKKFPQTLKSETRLRQKLSYPALLKMLASVLFVFALSLDIYAFLSYPFLWSSSLKIKAQLGS